MNKGQEKTQRLRLVLSHKEADRVPIGEFFWTGFVNKCKKKWGAEFDPHRHFDLDYVVFTPNIDPKIRPFEVLRESGDEVVVKTGFDCVIRRSGDAPMPYYESFAIDSPEAMADFEFGDPADPRRFFEGGDDQMNCVRDVLLRDIPSWEERLSPYLDDFAVFGALCDPYEFVWRCTGVENALTWMVTDPQLFADFVARASAFNLEMCRAQIEAGKGRLAGMYFWGDVAYTRGMIFGAPRWRELFKPHLGDLLDLCHEHGLMVIYHCCGLATDIFEDLIEIGTDAFNPLECKAGYDVVDVKRQYAGRLAFCGNISIPVLERGNPEEIRAEALYKLQAAKGGGWIAQSDHSPTTDVAPESYELVVKLIREFGGYPLRFPKL